MEFTIGIYEAKRVLVRVSANTLEEAMTRVETLYDEDIIFSDNFGTVVEHSVEDETEMYEGLTNDEVNFECDFINLNKSDDVLEEKLDLDAFDDNSSWGSFDEELWEEYDKPVSIKSMGGWSELSKLMGGKL